MNRSSVERLQATSSAALCVVVFTFFPGVSSGSTRPAESGLYCAAAEYERWLRENPVAAGKAATRVGSWERNRRTVRMLYFHPAGTEYRENVVDSMKVLVRAVQTFYREQMAAHGYGERTFRIETDAEGEPLVHRVTGEHEADHYQGSDNSFFNLLNIDLDLRERFNFVNNVYLVFLDHVDLKVGGWGSRSGRHGGVAKVKVISRHTDDIFRFNILFELTAHELGHAFGLNHDFRGDGYIGYMMSYIRPDRISACAAARLSVHPYFNDEIPLEAGTPPTLELISSNRYPSGATGVSARVSVSDAEGVHYVELSDAVKLGGSILTCRTLSGEKDAVVEFEYEFLDIPGFTRKGLLQRVSHEFFVDVTDIHGNEMNDRFKYVEVSRHQIAVLEGGGWVWSVAFSPDGTILAAASGEGTAKLWDVASREAIATLYPRSSQVTSVNYSPDGRILAGTAGSDVNLWDVASGEVVAALRGGLYGTSDVDFSPDGTTLAAGCSDGAVRLWDVASREEIAALEGHSDWIESVAFSPDGTRLASGSSDGTAKLWDVASREAIATLTERYEGNSVYAVAFSPDGSTLAFASGFRVAKWDMASLEEIGIPVPHRNAVASLAFSPDGTSLASGTVNGAVWIWDIATGHIVNVAHINRINSVAFSPDGTTLAAGTSDGKIVLWDMSPYFAPVYKSADLDGDGAVGFGDFVTFTAKFGTSRGQAGYDARCDLDWDGSIGFSDFLIFANVFGQGA